MVFEGPRQCPISSYCNGCAPICVGETIDYGNAIDSRSCKYISVEPGAATPEEHVEAVVLSDSCERAGTVGVPPVCRGIGLFVPGAQQIGQSGPAFYRRYIHFSRYCETFFYGH